MKKIKIITVAGTRPEAIKMAPVLIELARHKARIESIFVTTGQHREMLDQVLEIFELTPDYNLKVMRPSQTPAEVTSRILLGFEKILIKEKPDIVLVQGDTTTVLACALAAYYQKVRIGHVEAGLRTGNKYYPFPEEMNRVLTDHLSDQYFAPTKSAKENLMREGIRTTSISITGNTSVDALLYILKKKKLRACSENKQHILVTLHRRESFGKPLENICRSLASIASDYPERNFIYPVHLNPEVKRVVNRHLGKLPNFQLIPPQDYVTFIQLMLDARIILTDSGGIQEEAPALGKPVLVLRNETERMEAVAAGTVKLVGWNSSLLRRSFDDLMSNRRGVYKLMAQARNPYGKGGAAERIVSVVMNGGRCV